MSIIKYGGTGCLQNEARNLPCVSITGIAAKLSAQDVQEGFAIYTRVQIILFFFELIVLPFLATVIQATSLEAGTAI